MLKKRIKGLTIGIVFIIMFSMISPSYADSQEFEGYRRHAQMHFFYHDYLKGYNDNNSYNFEDQSFNLDDNLTREQLAVFINRITRDDRDANLKFTDSDEISDWALDAIETGVSEGYLSGYPDGSFKPKALIKTNEVIKIAIGAFEGTHDLEFPKGYMDMAKKDGLLYAVSCGENENITREDAVTLLYNAAVAYEVINEVEFITEAAAR